MSFITQMLSDDAKISSKRFIGFASFVMLVGSWVANTFFEFAISEQILQCFMYITVVGLGVTAAEKFASPK
jgi:predicted membrane-bound spermidine synthase